MSRKQQEISVSQLGNVAYASAPGLTLLKIGDQPIVATGDFTSYLGKIIHLYGTRKIQQVIIAFGEAELARRRENIRTAFAVSEPVRREAFDDYDPRDLYHPMCRCLLSEPKA